jgi:hypothetical protein
MIRPEKYVFTDLPCSTNSGYAIALHEFIAGFNFRGLPLDIALRKLLMEIGLPRETQQIDRVMEAFAQKYLECNPGLYTINGEHGQWYMSGPYTEK